MACNWPLRRYFRLLWWTLCLLTFLALPLTIWEFQKQHYNVHYQAWFIGGIFVILSMPISIYEIAMHTEYYTQPRLQKHVIRILLMVPIYAVDAWFALRFQKAREYLDPIRECYEAFVIYSFLAYLMAYLQDSLGDLDEHMAKKPPVQHMWGVRWLLRPWDMSSRFLWECKKGVLNYVILRPVCTLLAFVTDIFGRYGEGQINFRASYVYLAAVTNFSQLWALYCLVLLYGAMHAELAPIRPLSKFLCIKAVVFVTFWQGIAIALLVFFGVIRRESWTPYDRLDVASGIQDFLICIEMFLAALAHAYAFPPREYMAGHSKGFFSNVRYIFDLRDVVDDVGLVVEEHVSSATSAVVKVPQRAVKKVANNIKKQFVGTAGSRSGRLMDEEEEEASKCALLGPAGGGGAGGAGGGGGGLGSGLSSARSGRRGSSGGSGGEIYGAAGAYGGGGAGGSSLGRELLTAPVQHLMLQEMDQAGPSSSLLLGGGGGGGPSSYTPLPPLPPASASLGAGGGGGGGAATGSSFSNLVTSALYHTRAGYGAEQYGGSTGAGGGGGGGGFGVGGLRSSRRRSGSGSGEYQLTGGPLTATAPSSSSAAAHEYGGGGGVDFDEDDVMPSASGGGVEVPLVAVAHGHGSAGGGGGGSMRSKVKEALARGARSGSGGLGGGGGSGGLGGGGGGGGEDAPYERLPMSSRRAHDE